MQPHPLVPLEFVERKVARPLGARAETESVSTLTGAPAGDVRPDPGAVDAAARARSAGVEGPLAAHFHYLPAHHAWRSKHRKECLMRRQRYFSLSTALNALEPFALPAGRGLRVARWKPPVRLHLLPALVLVLSALGCDPARKAEQGQSVQALTCTTCGNETGVGGVQAAENGGLHPPPVVVAPEVAFAARYNNLCLPQTVLEGIRASLAKFRKNADVRDACVNGTQLIGIWLGAPSAMSPATARDAGVKQVALLQADEMFALRFSAEGIHHSVEDAYNARPHEMDENGDADPDGPVFLDTLKVVLGPVVPMMAAVIEGHVEKAINLGFTMTRAEQLYVSGGKVACIASSKPDVPAMAGLDLLSHLLFFDPLDLILLDFDRGMHGKLDALAGKLPTGCTLGSVIPDAIPMSGSGAGYLRGRKLDFQYTRLECSPTQGITAGGQFTIVHRVPSVTITGPGQAPSHGTSVGVSIETNDLVPPLLVQWSSDGKIGGGSTKLVSDLVTASVGVSWQPPPNATEWLHTGKVHVVVTDADGLTAEADKGVYIHYMDGTPKICVHKPDLPQCDIERSAP